MGAPTLPATAPGHRRTAVATSMARLASSLRSIQGHERTRDRLAVLVVRLDPELPLPSYAHAGDAGLDLQAREGAILEPAAAGRGADRHRHRHPAGTRRVRPPRGLALKHGVTVVNAPGLIDAAYRGEVKVVLLNTDPTADYKVTAATASPSSSCSASRR